MDVILTHAITDISVVLDSSQTFYDPLYRTDYAYILFVNNKKTTGDATVNVPVINRLADFQWTLLNVADGYYKAELIMIPTFAIASRAYTDAQLPIPIGVVTFYNGLFYRSVNLIPFAGDFPTPDVDYNNWEEIDITYIDNVYKEDANNNFAPNARIYYGFTEFVYYNNLVLAFLNTSKEITKSCFICNNPQIEELRCLRDTYESVELAVAAGNYSGAQTIIESSQNLVNSCSC
jgi:hypothetical protein